MNWYYVEEGQQRGPVAEPELDGLVQAGKVTADTLVWREGLANWQPYGQVRPGAAGGLRVAPAPPGASAQAAASAGGAEVVCTECGGIFSRDQTIRYGDAWVCATCKPLFVQKLKEGAALSGAGMMVYAGFWIRFAAYFIDQIVLGLAGGVLGIFLGVTMSGNTPEVIITRQLISMFVGIVLGATYYTLFNGKFGATPGKMACRIKIVTAEGLPISYGRACGRYFASILSGLICSIGYIMAAFDEEKRALHDRICNTRVIRL